MPLYELAIVFRAMPKMETAATLKRVSEAIFNKNGVLEKMEYLGTRPAPFKIRAHGTHYKEASYFSLKFHLDTKDVEYVDDEYKRDIDVIKRRFMLLDKVNHEKYPCNLYEESLPPAYRSTTQEMIRKGRKCVNPYTYKFRLNSNIPYYPFSK